MRQALPPGLLRSEQKNPPWSLSVMVGPAAAPACPPHRVLWPGWYPQQLRPGECHCRAGWRPEHCVAGNASGRSFGRVHPRLARGLVHVSRAVQRVSPGLRGLGRGPRAVLQLVLQGGWPCRRRSCTPPQAESGRLALRCPPRSWSEPGPVRPARPPWTQAPLDSACVLNDLSAPPGSLPWAAAAPTAQLQLPCHGVLPGCPGRPRRHRPRSPRRRASFAGGAAVSGDAPACSCPGGYRIAHRPPGPRPSGSPEPLRRPGCGRRRRSTASSARRRWAWRQTLVRESAQLPPHPGPRVESSLRRIEPLYRISRFDSEQLDGSRRWSYD
mmetsp:Transcript_963/g.2397  ORF Transcript_963/g.2397 Transcript_963/m.2397 type:complete len:327 (+) Transcript_963:287-1267(+)